MYKLSLIPQSQYQRLIADSICYYKYSLLNEEGSSKNTSLNWAFDCESDSYLILVPMERYHKGNWHYFFHFNNSSYQFHINFPYYEVLIFDSHLNVGQGVILAARAALLIFGETGIGDTLNFETMPDKGLNA